MEAPDAAPEGGEPEELGDLGTPLDLGLGKKKKKKKAKASPAQTRQDKRLHLFQPAWLIRCTAACHHGCLQRGLMSDSDHALK